jgi:type IV pilus assembly protein PilE
VDRALLQAVSHTLERTAAQKHALVHWARTQRPNSITHATRVNGGYSVVAESLHDGPMADDHLCGAFRLDATGQRNNSGAAWAADGSASSLNPVRILPR